GAGTVEVHADETVPGDDVAQTGLTDRVVPRKDSYPRQMIAHARHAQTVRADGAGDDGMETAALEHDAIATEAADVQGTHGGVAAADLQALRVRPGVQAVEHDHRVAATYVARLAAAVDVHLVGDRRQGRARVKDLRPRRLDVELDDVGAGVLVGVEDRLAERTRAGVEGVAHRVGGQQLPPLQRFQAQAASGVGPPDHTRSRPGLFLQHALHPRTCHEQPPE